MNEILSTSIIVIIPETHTYRPLKPPDPPDETKTLSFKDILLNKNKDLNHNYEVHCDENMEMDQELNTLSDEIRLSQAELQRLHQLWKASVIIKVLGKHFPHLYLKNKLMDMW